MKSVTELKEMAGRNDVWPDEDWGSALVRGHHDERAARELVAADRVYSTGCDEQSFADVWDDATVRQVYARCVPCSPTNCGEHAVHIVLSRGPGRGAFKATEVVRPWPARLAAHVDRQGGAA